MSNYSENKGYAPIEEVIAHIKNGTANDGKKAWLAQEEKKSIIKVSLTNLWMVFSMIENDRCGQDIEKYISEANELITFLEKEGLDTNSSTFWNDSYEMYFDDSRNGI